MNYLHSRKPLVDKIRDIATELDDEGLSIDSERLLKICYDLLAVKPKAKKNPFPTVKEIVDYTVETYLKDTPSKPRIEPLDLQTEDRNEYVDYEKESCEFHSQNENNFRLQDKINEIIDLLNKE